VLSLAERCSSLERLREPDEPSRQYFPLSNDAPGPGLRNAGHGRREEGGGDGVVAVERALSSFHWLLEAVRAALLAFFFRLASRPFKTRDRLNE